MKRNRTNARNAGRHFLAKEEHNKESEVQGNITMLAIWPINMFEEKESTRMWNMWLILFLIKNL